MAKFKNFDAEVLESIKEPLGSFEKDEITDDVIKDLLLEAIQDEIEDIEAICSTDNSGNVILTKMDIINTLFSHWVPGYKICIDVNNKTKVVDIYISES